MVNDKQAAGDADRTIGKLIAHHPLQALFVAVLTGVSGCALADGFFGGLIGGAHTTRQFYNGGPVVDFSVTADLLILGGAIIVMSFYWSALNGGIATLWQLTVKSPIPMGLFIALLTLAAGPVPVLYVLHNRSTDSIAVPYLFVTQLGITLWYVNLSRTVKSRDARKSIILLILLLMAPSVVPIVAVFCGMVAASSKMNSLIVAAIVFSCYLGGLFALLQIEDSLKRPVPQV